jgi:hypothetical protein
VAELLGMCLKPGAPWANKPRVTEGTRGTGLRFQWQLIQRSFGDTYKIYSLSARQIMTPYHGNGLGDGGAGGDLREVGEGELGADGGHGRMVAARSDNTRPASVQASGSPDSHPKTRLLAVGEAVAEPPEYGIEFGRRAAQGAQPGTGMLCGVQRLVQGQHRYPGGYFLAVDGVDDIRSARGRYPVLQDPARRPARPEDLAFRRRRRRPGRGDVVVRDVVDRPHMAGAFTHTTYQAGSTPP